MTYEEWIEIYKPIKNHLDDNANQDGTMFETYGAEREYIVAQIDKQPNNIWTMVQGDDDSWIIIENYHYVNRMGYFITKIPHNGGSIEILVADSDEDNDEEV